MTILKSMWLETCGMRAHFIYVWTVQKKCSDVNRISARYLTVFDNHESVVGEPLEHVNGMKKYI